MAYLAERNEQLETLAFWIFLANAAHGRSFIRFETNYFMQRERFFRDGFGAGFRGREIVASLEGGTGVGDIILVVRQSS